MKLYFCFSAPISGPISEPSGGFGDLDSVVYNEAAARSACETQAGPHADYSRYDAWFNEFDTETLEVSKSVWFSPEKSIIPSDT